jgi:catechol 2,3-dioxygenase-like lactoylglutathione lyase family enzyme
MKNGATTRTPGDIPLERPTQVVARADSLLYLHVARPDMDKATKFLTDFGLLPATRQGDTVHFRGVGESPVIYSVTRAERPALLAVGLSVPDRASLQALAEESGANIEPFTGPGGGEMVRLRDPDGVCIEVLHGQAKAPSFPSRPPIPHNAPAQTVRVNDTQRPPLAPPEVTKLGHIVLTSVNFPRKAQWYMRMLGFIPSDVLCLPDATPAGSFMRLDRGATPSDHHTLFVVYGAGADIVHAAVEVVDLDAVEMGQQVLKAAGYRHAWGVGRHLLGSQIFDYWRDPWALKHEHYADGDLFDASQPPGYHKLDREGLYQWGPDLPDDFVAARPSLGQVVSLLRGAMRGELALRPLIAAARSMRAPGRPWQR